MCFNLCDSSAKRPQPNVAEKDITVWKVLKKNNEGLFYDLKIGRKIEPWTKGFHYTETTAFRGAKRENSLFGYTTRHTWWEFTANCFHSCKTREQARNKASFNPTERKVVKMIIPKGALYYTDNREYISSEIIFPEE